MALWQMSFCFCFGTAKGGVSSVSLGPFGLDPAHICSWELSLQENLIGALLAIFGHLVVSIALNLQVSLGYEHCLGTEIQLVSWGVWCGPSCLLAMGRCPHSIPGLPWAIPCGCSRISLDSLPPRDPVPPSTLMTAYSVT